MIAPPALKRHQFSRRNSLRADILSLLPQLITGAAPAASGVGGGFGAAAAMNAETALQLLSTLPTRLTSMLMPLLQNAFPDLAPIIPQLMAVDVLNGIGSEVEEAWKDVKKVNQWSRDS